MLPSTKRPKEVEEERAAKLAEELKLREQRQRITIKITSDDIFHRTMGDWYKRMNEKDKKRLTPLELKRKAISVCYTQKKVYDTLPQDWIQKLHAEYGLMLYKRKRRAKPPNDTMRASNTDNSRRDPRLRSSTQTASETAGPSTVCNGDSKKFTEKKFLDLTKDPPPPAWLEAYCKGVELPRALIVYPKEDVNMLFYDYDPKFKDSFGNDVEVGSKPRLGVHLFKPKGDGKKKSSFKED